MNELIYLPQFFLFLIFFISICFIFFSKENFEIKVQIFIICLISIYFFENSTNIKEAKNKNALQEINYIKNK